MKITPAGAAARLALMFAIPIGVIAGVQSCSEKGNKSTPARETPHETGPRIEPNLRQPIEKKSNEKKEPERIRPRQIPRKIAIV